MSRGKFLHKSSTPCCKLLHLRPFCVITHGEQKTDPGSSIAIMQCPQLRLLSCFHLKLEITCYVGLVPEAEGWAALVSCVLNLYSCWFGCCMPLVSASWNLYDFVRKALKASLSHCGLNGRMFASHVSTGMSKFRMARWIPMASPTPTSFRSRWLSLAGQVFVSLLWVFTAVFYFRALGHWTNPGFLSTSCDKYAVICISNICLWHATLRTLRRTLSSSDSPMPVNQIFLDTVYARWSHESLELFPGYFFFPYSIHDVCYSVLLKCCPSVLGIETQFRHAHIPQRLKGFQRARSFEEAYRDGLSSSKWRV